MCEKYTTQNIALLAQALSGEYGVRITVGGDQAYTDMSGKRPVINIPSLDMEHPAYKILIRGYLDHEAGHVRFTDRCNNHPHKFPTINLLANIFEDVYVERSMAAVFPGCRTNLRKLSELLFDRSTAIPEGELASLLENDAGYERAVGAVFHYILYRVRSDITPELLKYLPSYRTVLDKIMPRLADLIEPVLKRLPQEGVSTAANRALAEEVHDIITKYLNLPGESTGEGRGSHRRRLADEWKTSRSYGTDVASIAAQKIAELIIDTGAEHIRLVKRTSCTWKNYVGQLSQKDIAEALRASTALDTQLQSLLQTRVLDRSDVRSTGRLHTKYLYRVSTHSNKIFAHNVHKLKINTEVIIVVDMSGSMEDAKTDVTSKALYSIMKSLRNIQGCSSGAIGFSGRSIVEIIRPEEKLTSQFLLYPYGATYCGEALAQAMGMFKKYESRKLIIFMTDGATYNQGYFLDSLKRAKDYDIEVVGVGIHDADITRYLPKDKCCVIRDLSQMVPQLFRILRTKLLE